MVASFNIFNTLTNGTDPEAAFIANKILRNRGVDINEHMRQLQILNNFDGKTTSDLDEKNRKSFNFWFIIILIIIAIYFLIHFNTTETIQEIISPYLD